MFVLFVLGTRVLFEVRVVEVVKRVSFISPLIITIVEVGKRG